ncbi:DUF4437 domain-containing protein [Aestuariibacter sp. AA17]|uniref:DUF4437 domain-containing protein n=1 Tax=Fluctibacter corallii TaxID=2984329 RepID=A0ABT3A8S4_9ALTE|nr:DUF4437 domain-containing protein [Aestuariibacter sp. AA17]MCV2885066.1 DUF4437 domain-containing protein [Aestuariibacter sp. AA17]
MKLSSYICLLALIMFAPFCRSSDVNPAQVDIITVDQLKWGYLNPLRGEKSPGAVDLWGDRTKNVATGMLVRFNKGFSSPPHIHNITYRGIVIHGAMHNDDPDAAHMWLPPVSFWTQPAGKQHVTAANADKNLIYLEIDSGPYLVKPESNHFDSGGHALNVHAANLVWLDHSQSAIVTSSNIEIAHLWRNNKVHDAESSLQGILLKLESGIPIDIQSQDPIFKAVIIQGAITYQSSTNNAKYQLEEGSLFSSSGDVMHRITPTNNAIIYIRSHADFSARAKSK